MLPKIVILSGKAQHGKTSVAEIMQRILEQEFSKKSLIMGFAHYLKYLASKYYKWDGTKSETGRALLQWLGTERVRHVDPNFWVRNVSQFIHMFGEDYDYIFMDDTRFPNEITYLIEDGHDVFTIRLERLNFQSSLTPEQMKHPSETSLDNWNFDLLLRYPTGFHHVESEIRTMIFENRSLAGYFPMSLHIPS